MGSLLLNRASQIASRSEKIRLTFTYNSTSSICSKFYSIRRKTLFSNSNKCPVQSLNFIKRDYKNFGHERDPPLNTYSKFYYTILTVGPILIFINYKQLLYWLNEDWYHQYVKKFEEVPQEAPRTPFTYSPEIQD